MNRDHAVRWGTGLERGVDGIIVRPLGGLELGARPGPCVSRPHSLSSIVSSSPTTSRFQRSSKAVSSRMSLCFRCSLRSRPWIRWSFSAATLNSLPPRSWSSPPTAGGLSGVAFALSKRRRSFAASSSGTGPREPVWDCFLCRRDTYKVAGSFGLRSRNCGAALIFHRRRPRADQRSPGLKIRVSGLTLCSPQPRARASQCGLPVRLRHAAPSGKQSGSHRDSDGASNLT